MIKELEIGSAREVLFWKRQEVKVNKNKLSKSILLNLYLLNIFLYLR